MSNEAITWAYKQPITTGAKFVLVALADLADESHSCYPGQAKLARMTGQGERTVRRQLAELEIAGYLTRGRRFDREGHRTSDRYTLPVGQEITTGQSGHRPEQPPVTTATGQADHRPSARSLAAIHDSPTGQDGQVSLSDPPGVDPSVSLTKANEHAEVVEQLCTRLADRVEANGSKRPTVTAKWRDAARLMIEKDGRTAQQIANAIDWCQADEFWRSNVMAMPKLRAKYDQLRLAAARTKPGGTPTNQSHLDRAAARLGVAR